MQQQQSHYQRKRSFLLGLANIMVHRNSPLPPVLTGLQTPTYDPTNSPWRTLEVSNTELGVIRLAGKDVDLYKLWALVLQAGGGAKACLLLTFSTILIYQPPASCHIKARGARLHIFSSFPNKYPNPPVNHSQSPLFCKTTTTYS